MLFDSILARAAQGDASATMAAIAIYEFPNEMTAIMKQFYTPEEPQMTPEQEMMIQQQMMQQQMGGQGGPPTMAQAFGM